MWEDLLESDVTRVAAIGVGAAMLIPALLPAAARAIKPVAKAAIKGGMLAYARGRESFAEVGEVFEDTYAEAQAELKEASQGHGESQEAKA